MRILAIAGKDLASLAGAFEVRLDAPPLVDAGVYAICGPTGAGKSTLLDAMCLALFHHTPRLGGRSRVQLGRAGADDGQRLDSEDPRGILRRGASDGYARVEFRGRDGRRYRATWTARRARGRADGRLQEFSQRLEDLDAGADLTGGTNRDTQAAITERLGLTFDQFRRSVLLAQGDFAAFLHASASERAELLERMTGTDIYARLSVGAFHRARQEKQALEVLEAEAGALAPLADDARDALASERDALGIERRAVLVRAEGARAAAQWHAERSRFQELLSRARTAADDADAAWTEAGGAGSLATSDARDAAVRALDDLRSLDVRVADLAEGMARARAARKQAGEAASTARSEAAAARGALDRVEAAIRDGKAWLERAAAWAPLAADWSGLLPELTTARDAQGALREARAQAAGARADLAALAASRQAAQEELERARARETKAAAAHAEAEARAVAADSDAAQRRLEQARQRSAAAAAWAEEGAARERAAQAADLAGAASQEAETLAVRLDEARRGAEEARAAQDLAAHRAALEPGQPCPLCGAREHPYVQGATAPDAALQVLRDRVKALEGERDRLRTTQASALATQRSEEALAARAAARAREAGVPDRPAGDLVALQRAEQEARAEVARVEALLREAMDRRKEEVAARKAHDAARSDATTAQKALDDLEKGILRLETALEGALASETAAFERFEDAADTLAPALAGVANWRDRLATDPARFVDGIRRKVEEYQRNARDREREEGRRPDLAKARDDAARRARLADESLAAAEKACVDAEAEHGDHAARRAHLFRGLATKEVAARLDRAAKAHDARAARAADLADHEATGAPTLDAEAASASLRDAEGRRGEIDTRIGQIQALLAGDDETRARIASYARRIAERTAAARTWMELSDLIGSADGRKFRSFAQGLSLQALLASANEHLRSLRPRYRLEAVPGADLELQVIDLDLAGEVRGVRSLSGGETFLVSLALALGLSSLAAHDVAIESLFVDEGFGSLDVETLETALATLDALQAEGRQVGLISHVPGIVERIGVAVRVEPEGGGRSRVVVG